MSERLVGRTESRWVQATLLIFVASVPFESAWTAGTAQDPLFSISRITGIALTASCGAFYRACDFTIPRAAFWYAGYVVAVLLAFAANGAEHAPDALGQMCMMLQMLVLFCIVYTQCRSRVVFQRVLSVLAFSITLLAALEILGIEGVSAQLNSRMSTFSEDPNTAGSVFAIGFIILAWNVLSRRPFWSRIAAAFCLPIVTVALARTGSRGALIALLIALALMIVGQCVSVRRPSTLFAAAAVLAALVAGIATADVMITRLERAVQQDDTAYRDQIWSSALEMAAEKPLLGWGPFVNYEELGQRTGQGIADTHNVFLLVLTQAGVLGVIPYCVGLAASFRGAMRARHDDLLGAVLPLIVCLSVLNLTLSWHNRKLHWIILAMALAAGTEVRQHFYIREITATSDNPLPVQAG